MAQNKLRVYCGPDDDCPATKVEEPATSETVTVPLGDVFPALAEAIVSRRRWIEDIADEEITISADLYDVILAYQHYRQNQISTAS